MNKDFILFVEDNADDVELTLISFKEFNFAWPVVVVRDGAEALEFLLAEGKHSNRNKEDAPILMILDLNLPKVHGLEVLQRIRADEHLKELTVAILSSSQEEKDVSRARLLGVSAYIRKPVDFDDSESVVQQLRDLLLSTLKVESPSLS